MNLHICSDSKFISGFIQNQKRYAPLTKNCYYVIGRSHIGREEFPNTIVELVSLKEMKQVLLRHDFSDCHQVIFHSLPTQFRKNLLFLIPRHIQVTWIFYGYEYYHRRDTIEKYLRSLTRSFYLSWSNPHFLHQCAHRIVDRLRREATRYQQDLQQIKRFAHWNPGEYQIIQARFNLVDLEYIPFSMGLPIHQHVSDPEYRYMLLGHSGALTVNHLDGLEDLPLALIEKFDRIIIPLSYGAGKMYQKKVKLAARKKLRDKAIFLEKYMDRNAYFNLLCRVKLAWMPQMRGMGGGNILYFLKNHIPIVFPKDSELYQYFVNQGFQVYNSAELLTEIPELSDTQRKENQKIMQNLFEVNVVKLQYQNLLSH